MNEPTNAELDQALNVRAPALYRLGQYYAGEQPLAYLSPDARKAIGQRFDRIAVNLPRLAVSAIAERLRVAGFTDADGKRDPALWAAWVRSDLDQTSPSAHREALAVGESAAIVWARPDGKASVSIESGRQVAVYRDAGTHEVLAAVKRWTELRPDGTEGATRWVVYRPDRIEHLIGDGAQITAARVLKVVDNPLLAVPVVPLTNADRPLDTFGVSEFADLIPVVDAINKLTADMLTASEFGARPRRWATGLELAEEPRTDDDGNPVLDEDGEPVMDVLNPVGDNDRMMVNEAAEGKFGQLPGADLSGYQTAVDVLLQQASAVSGLPGHYLGLNTTVPASADAIRAAEAALTARAEARQAVFGRAWEQVGRLILAVEHGGEVTDYSPRVQWADPATRSAAQEADAVVKLHAAGIISTTEARTRLGIDNPDLGPTQAPAAGPTPATDSANVTEEAAA
ncbi:phage portal protein [Gordonia alkanivorans]|uniref:phage portal protein n=1 Tax=Gordonia TaxID=2053 RepID=UPI0012BB3F23|nr:MULTISPECIES: phage portal protein [Gordonia]MDH3025309.1 phage portal protein [Gordonia alkanivorans]QGP87286.1 phage portal protein [Gordonia sp. 135]